MSKSKHGNSNLYMTTREFADLVVEALDKQNYFKDGDVAHPEDIAVAFSTVGETIGTAMYWAIKQEHDSKKEAVMKTKDLRKTLSDIEPALLEPNEPLVTKDFYSSAAFKKAVLPQDEEIAPSSLSYSEYKANKGYM